MDDYKYDVTGKKREKIASVHPYRWVIVADWANLDRKEQPYKLLVQCMKRGDLHVKSMLFLDCIYDLILFKERQIALTQGLSYAPDVSFLKPKEDRNRRSISQGQAVAMASARRS